MIVAFVQNGQTEAARSLAEQLPRRSGYFNIMRNNIPKIIDAGDLELALSLLASFQSPGSVGVEEADANKDYGMFILRAMSNSNYR